MEAIHIKNSKGINLVGDLYSNNSEHLVIMAHGFTNIDIQTEDLIDWLIN